VTKKRVTVTRRRARPFGGITDSPEPENPHEALLTVTYWAISILNSKTFWLNTATFTVMALTLSEVVTVIPARATQSIAALVAVLNVWLRMQTVRPVALIAPFRTKAVDVPRLGPPPPPVLTD
jgi:hypothetical protein